MGHLIKLRLLGIYLCWSLSLHPKRRTLHKLLEECMQTLFGISLEAGSKTLVFDLQTDCVGDPCPPHLHHSYPPMGLLPLPFAALVTGRSFS